MTTKNYSASNIVKVGDFPYTSPTALYFPQIIKYHLDNNTYFRSETLEGTLKSKTIEDVENFFAEMKAEKKYKSSTYTAYMLHNSLFIIVMSGVNITITIGCNDDRAYDVFLELKNNYVCTSKKDLVFSIVKDGSDLKIRNIGVANLPLVEDNYSKDVIADYKYVCKVFGSKTPSGRICILNGPPGTGKSSLIRASLSDIDALFIVVPSNMLSALDKPEFLPLLLDVKKTHDKPIILIVEDGDSCLVPRKSDNISVISSLLNLSDGIIGSIIDIRIFVTTNSEVQEIDEAIMRPGRLCKNINIDPLNYDDSNIVYQRLTGLSDKLEKADFYTLAQIYAIANNPNAIKDKQVVIKKSKRAIGFGHDTNEQVLNSR